MPVGGAADRMAFVLGNALLGNPPTTVALELSLAGPTLESTDTHACVVFGAPFAVRLNHQPIPAARPFATRPGDLLTIGTSGVGLRAYLCVGGGFQTPQVLDSHSRTEPIHANEELPAPVRTARARFITVFPVTDDDPGQLRVLPGSHAGQFPWESFLAAEYAVRPKSNRMGLRLSGPPIARQTDQELVSAPVCPGTVQVTHDGQAVVLGVDAQTIGGYPRIAQVISADLDKLAQLRPNDRIRFVQVDLATAQALHQRRLAWQREWVARLLHPAV